MPTQVLASARDVVDGHVALLEARLDGVVVTSNPADITRFGDSIMIEAI